MSMVTHYLIKNAAAPVVELILTEEEAAVYEVPQGWTLLTAGEFTEWRLQNPIPEPKQYYLVESPAKVNPILWDGVSDYNPPEGWILMTQEEFNEWRLQNPEPPQVISVPQSVGSGQIRAALIVSGVANSDDALSATIEAALDQISDPAQKQIAITLWRNASEFRRDNQFITMAQIMLGMTNEQIDDLFRLAATF